MPKNIALPISTQELVARFNDGDSASSLAREFATSGPSIIRALRAAGVTEFKQGRRKGSGKLTGLPISTEYADGGTLIEIGDKYGVSPSSVYRHLQAVGAATRTPGRRRKVINDGLTDEQRAAAKAERKVVRAAGAQDKRNAKAVAMVEREEKQARRVAEKARETSAHKIEVVRRREARVVAYAAIKAGKNLVPAVD